MSCSKISSANVFLALVDLNKPSRAVDVTDYLAGETGADSRRIALTVRCQLDQLVRRGCITKSDDLYMVIRDKLNGPFHPNVTFELREPNRPTLWDLRYPCTTTIPTPNHVNVSTKSNVTAYGDNNPHTRKIENSMNVSGCLSIAAIPPQIRRDNPVPSNYMSESEIRYTQRFWNRARLHSMKPNN